MKTSDPDDIHDLRVASRRFRAALELYYPLAPKGSKTKLRKSVQNLTRILGGLRNIDEARLFFRSRVIMADSDDDRICRIFSDLRPRELNRIIKTIKAFDHHKLDLIVREMVAGLNQERIAIRNRFSLLAYFSEMSIKRFLPIHQLLAVSTVPGHHEARHALRIAIKKWRYFLEIISQVLGSDYSRILEQLREYQSLLGRMNDIVVFGEMLGNLELSVGEQEHANAVLKQEEELLQASFEELIGRDPITYTFLI